MREIRRFLATQSEPHCVGPDGKSRHGLTPETCPGTWAATITPNLAANTVLIMLADNGWHLPHSKHQFTENAYRTRLIVFDPKALPSVPGWDATQEVTPPAQESNALAHAVDVYATAVGYALGTPGASSVPWRPTAAAAMARTSDRILLSAPGGPAPRRRCAVRCAGTTPSGPRQPTDFRYLLTREGSVGRCTNLAAPSCNDNGDCSGGAVCVGGHCAPGSEPACSTTAQCPAGAVCFGAKCRAGPSCIEDADCANLFPGQSYACVEKDTRWCRNDPACAAPRTTIARRVQMAAPAPGCARRAG